MTMTELHRVWDQTPGERFASIGQGPVRRAITCEFRALLDSSIGAIGAETQTPATPSLARRRRFVRDLLRDVPTLTRRVPYVQEIAAAEGDISATATAEGEAKAETEMQFGGGELTVGKVTAWISATTEIYEDAPGLAAYVDGRLGEELGLAEDHQLLLGNGDPGNILGFFEVDGLQTQAAITDDLVATVALAASKVENVGTQVDGVVVNTLDYWTARVERHSSQLDGAAHAFDENGDILGIPTVRTTKMPRNRALVGAFGIGATLRPYLPVTVRETDSHEDWFVENKHAILAETLEALTVHRPDYFCDTTVAFS